MTLNEVKEIITQLHYNDDFALTIKELNLHIQAIGPEKIANPTWTGQIGAIVYDSPWQLSSDAIGTTFTSKYIQELIVNMLTVHALRKHKCQVEMMGDEAPEEAVAEKLVDAK